MYFDEWLRERAAAAGAKRRTGLFKRFERDETGNDRRLLRGTCGAMADGEKPFAPAR